MNIETFLQTVGERYTPIVVGVLLAAAALSFLARHRAQTLYGRIREYGVASVGLAAAFGGLAAFYLVLYVTALETPIRQGAVRLLLSMLSAAAVGFNWGGVRVAMRDVRDGIKRLL